MSIFIIAEAGVNHNGCFEEAIKLVEEAKKSGCDAIKFQTFNYERVAGLTAQLSEYQSKNTSLFNNQRDMLKSLQLSKNEFKDLKRFCDELKIEFMSTPSDTEDLEFLISLDIKRIKIGSSDIDNKALLFKAAKTGLQIIISTGMSTYSEVERAVNYLKSFNNIGEIIIMQCTSQYPCPDEEINLNVLDTYKNNFKNIVGFSDHSLGNMAAICSIAKGAKYIEKHFTLSKDLDGPDHKASLDPQELKEFVSSIRNAEKYLGNNNKLISNCEKENRKKMRKSLIENKDGSFLIQRPPNRGLDPWMWNPKDYI